MFVAVLKKGGERRANGDEGSAEAGCGIGKAGGRIPQRQFVRIIDSLLRIILDTVYSFNSVLYFVEYQYIKRILSACHNRGDAAASGIREDVCPGRGNYYEHGEGRRKPGSLQDGKNASDMI